MLYLPCYNKLKNIKIRYYEFNTKIKSIWFFKDKIHKSSRFSTLRSRENFIRIKAKKSSMYTAMVDKNLRSMSDKNLERLTNNMIDSNCERILRLLQQWDFNEDDENLYVKIVNVSYGDINIFNTIMAKRALKQLELNYLSKRLYLYRSENSIINLGIN